MVINAQNKEKYLEDLKNWLRELESAPLEEMGAFFRKRLPEYEARMTKFWGEDYKQFARAVPQSAKRILDLGCGTGLELDALYNLRTDISVTGIDLSPDMLDALMKKHGDKDLTLLCGSREDYAARVNEYYETLQRAGEEDGFYAMCFDEDVSLLEAPTISYGVAYDYPSQAQNLFDVLRQLDKLQATEVYVHAPEPEEMGLAVYNRLLRAAAFRVVHL